MLFYHLLAGLLAPVVLAAMLWRVARGRETISDFAQRIGGGRAGPSGRAIWLHGASNGELTSARPLVESILRDFPTRALVVTANTVTARDMVAGWGLGRVSARLAPLDLRWCLARFRARWRPVAEIILENEIWPNRIVTAREPVLCVAARMSERSAARWGRLGGLARRLLGRVYWLGAQDQGSAARFVALGLDRARLGPVVSLKPAVRLALPPQAELAALARVFARGDTVLAASTHAGEDAILLDAFAAARADNPVLKLIIAPRHPRRAEEIATLVRRHGFALALRGPDPAQRQAPDAGTEVYLAATIGEMALWYALAGVTFVGGSLVNKGGHTPFEPAQAGSAIVHGPHVANFQAAYEALDTAGGAVCAGDAAALARALTHLRNADVRAGLAQTAQQVLAQSGHDATASVLTALRTALSTPVQH